LDHLEDFEQRIPRTEMVELEAAVLEAIKAVNPALEACAAGSYRRGAAASGDIDVLIQDVEDSYQGSGAYGSGDIRNMFGGKSPTKASPQQKRKSGAGDVLGRVVAKLKETGFVTEDLSLGSRQYHGVAKLNKNSPHRRLDLLLFPREEFACALLHFTGSGGFNRHMRAHALEAGFTLNEKGLHRGTAGAKAERVTVESEADVFRAIGMDFREPKSREMGK